MNKEQVLYHLKNKTIEIIVNLEHRLILAKGLEIHDEQLLKVLNHLNKEHGGLFKSYDLPQLAADTEISKRIRISAFLEVFSVLETALQYYWAILISPEDKFDIHSMTHKYETLSFLNLISKIEAKLNISANADYLEQIVRDLKLENDKRNCLLHNFGTITERRVELVGIGYERGQTIKSEDIGYVKLEQLLNNIHGLIKNYVS